MNSWQAIDNMYVFSVIFDKKWFKNLWAIGLLSKRVKHHMVVPAHVKLTDLSE